MVRQRKITPRTWLAKILIGLSCGFLFYYSHTPFVYADSATGNIAVESREGHAGERVEVKVEITSNPGIVGIKIPIEYDNTGLMLVEVNAGDIFSDMTYSPSYEDMPYLIVAMGDMENTTETGTLATLVFEIRPDALPGEYPVRIEIAPDTAYDIEEEYIAFTSTDGSVHVVEDTESSVDEENSELPAQSENDTPATESETDAIPKDIVDAWVLVGISICIIFLALYM